MNDVPPLLTPLGERGIRLLGWDDMASHARTGENMEGLNKNLARLKHCATHMAPDLFAKEYDHFNREVDHNKREFDRLREDRNRAMERAVDACTGRRFVITGDAHVNTQLLTHFIRNQEKIMYICTRNKAPGEDRATVFSKLPKFRPASAGAGPCARLGSRLDWLRGIIPRVWQAYRDSDG